MRNSNAATLLQLPTYPNCILARPRKQSRLRAMMVRGCRGRDCIRSGCMAKSTWRLLHSDSLVQSLISPKLCSELLHVRSANRAIPVVTVPSCELCIVADSTRWTELLIALMGALMRQTTLLYSQVPDEPSSSPNAYRPPSATKPSACLWLSSRNKDAQRHFCFVAGGQQRKFTFG